VALKFRSKIYDSASREPLDFSSSVSSAGIGVKGDQLLYEIESGPSDLSYFKMTILPMAEVGNFGFHIFLRII
jgi:hypothetical protein